MLRKEDVSVALNGANAARDGHSTDEVGVTSRKDGR